MKNDERDAKDLAAMLRLGRLAEGWIAPPEVRELRELVRQGNTGWKHWVPRRLTPVKIGSRDYPR